MKPVQTGFGVCSLIHYRSLICHASIEHLIYNRLYAGSTSVNPDICLCLPWTYVLLSIKANDSLCENLDVVRGYWSMFACNIDFDISFLIQGTWLLPTQPWLSSFLCSPSELAHLNVNFQCWAASLYSDVGLSWQARWVGSLSGYDCASNSGSRSGSWAQGDLSIYWCWLIFALFWSTAIQLWNMIPSSPTQGWPPERS